MSVATSTAVIIGGTLAAGSGIASSVIGSHAASSAAEQQAQSAQQAIDLQREEFNTQQQNIAPWLDAGKTSLGSLMQGFQNGTFGPGSIPAFHPPSLADARNSPGYQFELGQGISAIQRSAAARGGLGSGSTLKSLQSFGTGLADSTYGDVFNRALSTYGAQLQGQTQSYNQLAGVAGTGQNAVNSINQLGGQNAQNIGNLMTQIGNANAAGTVGSANAITGGINSGVGGLTSSLLLGSLMGQGGSGLAGINTGLQGGLDSSGYFGKTAGLNIDPNTFAVG